MELLETLNTRTYTPKQSNCYVITDPALNCINKCNKKIRENVPERRKMNPQSDYGIAIGNLTSQAASNLNLSDFDIWFKWKNIDIEIN